MSAAPGRAAALVALALTITGCGVHGPLAPGGADRSAPAGDDPAAAVAERLGTAPRGASIALDPGGPLRARSASVSGEYTAASGHLCRRVLLDGSVDPTRIVCRDGAGRWYLPRALDAAARSTIAPFAGIETSVGPGAGPGVGPGVGPGAGTTSAFVRPIIAGETLWDFARRTTGNGRNWPAIAARNDIADTRKIPAGAELTVPVELVRQEI